MNKLTCSLILMFIFFWGESCLADTWDGVSSDVSWYSENSTEFHIKYAAQLKGLSDLVKKGNSFEGKTVYLDDDLNMASREWQPIGGNVRGGGSSFSGIFDGQSHEITNLYPVVDGDASYLGVRYLGLFGEAGKKSILKNLLVSGNTNIGPQSSDFAIYVGGLVGRTDGTIENVHSQFDTFASTYVKAYVENLCVGGVCGQGNIINKAAAKGELTFAVADIYWRPNHCYIGGVAGIGKIINEVSSECEISSGANAEEVCIGGIVGKVEEEEEGAVKNACFYGSIDVQEDPYDYGHSSLFNGCSGIVGVARGNISDMSCCISAPKSFVANFTSHWINLLIGDNSSYNYTGSNNYYTIPTGYSKVLGNQIDETTLLNATSLPGFDSNIWDFSTKEKPMLKNLKVKYCVSVHLDKGEIGYWVNEGENLSLKLIADEGYEISKVYFNDLDMTEYLHDGVLDMANISSNGELKFIFIQNVSAIDMIENNSKPNLSIEGKTIIFKGIEDNQRLRVYTGEGKLVLSKFVTSNQAISLNNGIYILKLGKYTFKISV